MKTFGKKKEVEKKVEKKIEEKVEEKKVKVKKFEKFNGEVIISERDVVINGVTKKEVTSKDGQTYIV